MQSTTPTAFSSSRSLLDDPCYYSSPPNPKLSKLSHPNFQTSDQQQKLYTFYLDIVLNSFVQLPKVTLSIPLSYTVNQAIQLVLQQFQRQLLAQCVIIEQDVEDFVPRLAKKSGRCQNDCPGIDRECVLAQLSVDTVSLEVKRKESVVIDERKKRRSSLEGGEYTEIGYRKGKVEEVGGDGKEASGCFYSFC